MDHLMKSHSLLLPAQLIEGINGNQEFYNLNNDPYEQDNLMNGNLTANENNFKLELETELIKIRQ